MAERVEREWQPARTFPAHLLDGDCAFNLTQEQQELAPKILLRIKETEPFDVGAIMHSRAIKHCDSKRFFLIHPEDAARLGFPFENIYLCEHEILTD